MKKYLFLFVLFCMAGVLYLSFPTSSNKHFVRIEDGKFKLNGKDFYPIAVNYIVSTRTDKNEIWPCPYFGYTPDSLVPPVAKDSCLMQLKADMELIKEMGFNSIRLVGIGDESVEDKQTGELSFVARLPNNKDTTIFLSNEDNYDKYFSAINEMFKIINEAGLKVIFKIHLMPDIESTSEHLKKIVSRFRNDTVIFAYDLFNEPLYFDSLLERTKEDVYQTVKKWRKTVKMYAPNHLTTIGLEGIREIFRWDPNILAVDFLSFHPYEFEPEQVMNELYWYGQYVIKPWIVGETAIPADNDSVTYEEQKQFARKTLKQTYNCGAIGYSWWQYKDVEWHSYRANFMGVVSRKGLTITTKSRIVVLGTPKPIAEEFKKYKLERRIKDRCLCLSNYYNYSQGERFRIIGKIMDENNRPIDGAVFLAWDQYWYPSFHTITKADGSFELMSDFPFYHWIASATLHSVTRGDIFPDTAKKYSDSIPTINLGDIKLQKLDL